GAPALGGAFLVILLIVLIASSGPSPAIGVARRFTHAWERSDYRAMYAMLTPAARRGIDAAGFTEAYRTAADTATATGVAAGKGVAGQMGVPQNPADIEALYARGFPQGRPVGQGGLERILEQRVAGRPGGTLLEGRRVVRRAASHPAQAVRTTIDLHIEAAA